HQVALGEDPDELAVLFDEDRAAVLRLHLVDDLPHRIVGGHGRVRPRRQLRDQRRAERVHEPPPMSNTLLIDENSLRFSGGVSAISSRIDDRARITSNTVSTPSVLPSSSTIGTLRKPSTAIQLIANATPSRGRSERGIDVMTSASLMLRGSLRSAA